MKTKENNQAMGYVKYIWNSLKHPLIATIFGLGVGALVMWAMGENPFAVYAQMFEKSFFSQYYLLQTLSRATPIIICAMATGMAWRAGYINIGVEGQMIVGGFVAAVVAIYMPGPTMLVLVVALLAGMVAGGLYASIPAVLNHKFGVSIVICSLMLNYVADFVTSYYVSFPLQDKSGDGLALQTVQIPEGLRFWKLMPKSTFNFAFFIAVAVTILLFLFMKYTVLGYESRMGGLNPFFARYGGVKQVKVLMITMFLSGAIASLAGSGEVFGVKYRFIDGMLRTPSYAWTGLMAALIANLNPIGMFFVSIFLAGLQVGGQSIQRSTGIPIEMSTIIQCCITLFVSIKLTFAFIKRKKAAAAQSDTLPPPTQPEAIEGGSDE